VVTQDMFYRHRQALEEAMARVPDWPRADREWAELTGRSHGVVERYRCDGARTVLVTMGSMCGTARDAVDALRDAGQAVGLLKLRLFRPLPVQALRAALAGVPTCWCSTATTRPAPAACCTRSCARALRHGRRAAHARLLAGVGGVNVSPDTIVEFVQQALQREPQPESQWVR
jgi:pyruvate/2-oxoacid:ferredoxin oxidoreductase alpha subunit